MPDPTRVKVTIHHADGQEPARPAPGVITSIYAGGAVVLLILVGLFTYLLLYHQNSERSEVEAVVNRFVALVNSKDNRTAMNMIDDAWYQVKNTRDTNDFLTQVEGLGAVKLDRRRTFTSEGTEGTIAYEISYSGHLGGQAAEISFRLIRRGQVLMIQAFRLE